VKHRAGPASRAARGDPGTQAGRHPAAQGRHQPVWSRVRCCPGTVQRRPRCRRCRLAAAIFPLQLVVVIRVVRRPVATPPSRFAAAVATAPHEPAGSARMNDRRTCPADVAAAATAASLPDELTNLVEVRLPLSLGGCAGRLGAAGGQLKVKVRRRRVKDVWTVRLVFLEVTVEVGLLAEAAFTQRTTKRLLLCAQTTSK